MLPSPTIRKLTSDDFEILDRFLVPYIDTSMFMRSNARHYGFVMNPEKEFSADYYGYFVDGELNGVVALCWQGAILCQVPDLQYIPTLFKFIQQSTPGFTIRMILGPTDQVKTIFSCLENVHPVVRDHIAKNSLQKIYTLDLNQIVIPSLLSDNTLKCRLVQHNDIPTLVPWRMVYNEELSFLKEEESLIIDDLISFIEAKTAFVLESQGTLVARSDFNAILPDTVQIGGVWVPPDFRNRGFARAVVAGSLLEAKKRGITKAVLFTDNPAAMRCYESLGFKENGIYHIMIFDKGL